MFPPPALEQPPAQKGDTFNVLSALHSPVLALLPAPVQYVNAGATAAPVATGEATARFFIMRYSTTPPTPNKTAV